MNIDIGIKEQDRAEIARGLGKMPADSYSLYLKTHNFHWNVTGPMFETLRPSKRAACGHTAHQRTHDAERGHIGACQVKALRD